MAKQTDLTGLESLMVFGTPKAVCTVNKGELVLTESGKAPKFPQLEGHTVYVVDATLFNRLVNIASQVELLV